MEAIPTRSLLQGMRNALVSQPHSNSEGVCQRRRRVSGREAQQFSTTVFLRMSLGGCASFFLVIGFQTPPLSTHSIGTDSSLIICSLLLLRRAIHTRASITGISIKGPTTVETATIGIDAKAVNAIAMASSKFLPVQ